MRSQRNSYAEVGTAMRAAVARARRADLSALEWNTFVAVLELTASWSKLADDTSTRQLAAMVYDVDRETLGRGQRDRVGAAVCSLSAKGVISTRRGRGVAARTRVSLTECTPAETHSSEGMHSVGDVNALPPRGRMHSDGWATPRSTPRSNPRERDREEEKNNLSRDKDYLTDSSSEVLRAFGPYQCPLGLGCDNGNIWDAQKNGVVRCECIKRKFARVAAAEAATP
jgi:hypothetical protein